MWGRRSKTLDAAHAADERSRRNAQSAEKVMRESERLTAVAEPLQRSIRGQVVTNHWAELIFGRLN